MRIEDDIKLDYRDVLIKPKRSTLTSRRDVEIKREFKFRKDFSPFLCPVIAANMSTVGTGAMNEVLSQHSMLTCLHKHISLDEFMLIPNIRYTVLSLGISDKDVEKFNHFYSMRKVHYACIDVANGYTQVFIDFVKRFRDKHPDIVLMAGNVASGEMTEELILSGVDLVKVGIGPGCLAADTRILMANGTYKNICDINSGDRVINQYGKPVTVKRAWKTGTRKVRAIRINNHYKPLILTNDHQLLIGDLRSQSVKTIQSYGYKKSLSTPDRSNLNKIKWERADGAIPIQTVALFPTRIEFEMPESFSIELELYSKRYRSLLPYNIVINDSYDLGYIFGTFLGDGHSKLDKNGSGAVSWTFGINEGHIADKLISSINRVIGPNKYISRFIKNDNVICVTLFSKQWALLFSEFDKRENKYLPDKYLAKNSEYLSGLLDGLIDSDGYISSDGRINFCNTSTRLIELYTVLCKSLLGSTPNCDNGSLQNSELVQAKNLAFRSRLNKSHDKRHLGDFEITKILGSEELDEDQEVWDLEIDDDSHSFIANNIIVHNSACTTRVKTGVGVPQLSAVIECSDAAHGLGGFTIADGGITNPGDIAKALGAGADFVMLGGMLAGHDESGGEIIEKDGKKYVEFYGMSSRRANEQFAGGLADYRSSEGRELLIPYKGRVEDTVREIEGGIRSACTYTGSRSVKELPKRTTFVRVNNQVNEIYKEHGE